MSSSQLNDLKSGITSSNVNADSNDENNFPHTLLLTNTHVLRPRKASANNSPADIRLSKTQLHKMGQPGGFFSRLSGPLLEPRLPLIGNVLKSLARVFNIIRVKSSSIRNR